MCSLGHGLCAIEIHGHCILRNAVDSLMTYELRTAKIFFCSVALCVPVCVIDFDERK